jgi:TPP-dependent pyruvate/acetoin dehydrogenase alpha subunit
VTQVVNQATAGEDAALDRAGRELAMRLYRTMIRIRAFDEELGRLAQASQVRGLYYAQNGQEACAAGVASAMAPGDYLVTTYRGNGDQVAAGADMRRMAAEIFGRVGGYCKGKGGVMHIAAFDVGVLGATGVVGGGLPIATGAAYSAQVRGTQQVAFCTFGDGATNQGTFHESLNMAALWKLPVVYVCYNNQYAEGTPRRLHQVVEQISTRALAYGMPGETLDGMDPLAVFDGVTQAVERARRGDGPTLIEAVCYRLSGHYVGDPMVYVPKDEMAEWRERDPVPAFERRLAARGWLDDRSQVAVLADAQAEVAEAITFAQSSPEPEPEDVLADVYASGSRQ